MKNCSPLFLLLIVCNISFSISNEQPIQGYFFLQKFYPGVNPLKNLEFTGYKPRLKYFILNTKLLYYSNSIEESRQIEDIIKLKDIIDERFDKIEQGICCANVKYIDDNTLTNRWTQKNINKKPLKKISKKAKNNFRKVIHSDKNKLMEYLFPNMKSNKRLKSNLRSLNKKKRFNSKLPPEKRFNEQEKLNLFFLSKRDKLTNFSKEESQKYWTYENIYSNQHITSNQKPDYCLEIFVINKAKWRLCSITPINIYRLYIRLIYNIITFSQITKDINKLKGYFYKFLSGFNLTVKRKTNLDWDWNNQDEWEDQCKSKLMQSPKMISQKNVSLKQKSRFKISYRFTDVNIEIVKNGVEAIVMFKENPGIILISYKNNYLMYQPRYLSFRFPAQHVILGKRYSGEILITCKEFGVDEVWKL